MKSRYLIPTVIFAVAAVGLTAAHAAVLVDEDWTGYTDGSSIGSTAVQAGNGLSGTWSTSGGGIDVETGGSDNRSYTFDDAGSTTITGKFVEANNSFQTPVLSATIDNLVDGGAITGTDLYFTYLAEFSFLSSNAAGLKVEFGGVDFAIIGDTGGSSIAIGDVEFGGNNTEPVVNSGSTDSFTASTGTTYALTGRLLWNGSEYSTASLWLNFSANHPTDTLAAIEDVDISGANLTSISTFLFQWEEPRSGGGDRSVDLGHVIYGTEFSDVTPFDRVIPEPATAGLLGLAGLALLRRRRLA